MTWVVVDAPKVDAGNVPGDALVATTTPIAYVRFHGRNAATWNTRGGSAAQRFDHLYSEDELREWVPATARAVERRGGGLRLLQQQQPDERCRSGAGRCAVAAQVAGRGRGSRPPDAVLAVTHGPLVRPELFADVIEEEGHELLAWDIRAAGGAAARVRRRDGLRRRPERRRGGAVSLAARRVRGVAALGRCRARRCSACASERRRSRTRSARPSHRRARRSPGSTSRR